MLTGSEVEAEPRRTPHVVVVGNEKGGVGKSTIAVHLAIALLYRGYRVATVDLDARQETMSRYFENRARWTGGEGRLPQPRNIRMSERVSIEERRIEDVLRDRLADALTEVADCHVVVMDTPGSDGALSRVGHERADTLLTPINDSLFDIDVLARIDPERRAATAPSFYTKMVWEHHNRRIVEGRSAIDWIVLRNRMPHIQSHNRSEIDRLLAQLAQRIGFRIAASLGERVVFRSLFAEGLTVMDLPVAQPGWVALPSQMAAVDEVAGLLAALGVKTERAAAAAAALSA
jgi:chromosome partitioning protein